jgi:hypothetical protein
MERMTTDPTLRDQLIAHCRAEIAAAREGRASEQSETSPTTDQPDAEEATE